METMQKKPKKNQDVSKNASLSFSFNSNNIESSLKIQKRAEYF